MRRDPEFVRAHRLDDVHLLALQSGRYPDMDMPWVVGQVDGWQRARHKVPRWAATEGIIYPPHLSMEQCSSEEAARYKGEVVRRLLTTMQQEGRLTTFVDLTGGLGVDHSFMAPFFDRSYFVERQDTLCGLARHNLPLLGLTHTEVVQGDAEEVWRRLPTADVVFLDPARRDSHGGRTWGIADCTPNILPMMPSLLEKAGAVMVKLSPMLDWHQAVSEMEEAGGSVAEVHIVDVGNECKELLFVVVPSMGSREMRLVCVHGEQVIDISPDERQGTPALIGDEEELRHITFLYEPCPAIMKSGCFAMLTQRYGVKAIESNSHLFVSEEMLEDFPGRMFHVQRVFTLNKREYAEALRDIDQANVTTRNFPLSTDQLRKKLHLRDGGQHYIFATTFQRKQFLFLGGKYPPLALPKGGRMETHPDPPKGRENGNPPRPSQREGEWKPTPALPKGGGVNKKIKRL
ncbi:MAG: SAM-dependent methyltransferase [Prevotella sp.]|nr:SAM-dependent methyltransferase [Prevotella sp.]